MEQKVRHTTDELKNTSVHLLDFLQMDVISIICVTVFKASISIQIIWCYRGILEYKKNGTMHQRLSEVKGVPGIQVLEDFKLSLSIPMILALADSVGGGARGTRHSRPKFLHFHSVFGKKLVKW